MKSIYKSEAIKLFLDKTKYKKSEILFVRKIHKGFTNISFEIILKDKQKFQIRLGQNNEIVNRENELNIIECMKNSNFLYIDKYGNAIKKWIMGYNPKFIFNKKKLLLELCKSIKEIHQINFKNSNLLKHDYYEYINDFIRNKYFNWYTKYIEILEKYKNLKEVFSHNDINPKNMIYDYKDKKIILIDFEWARINNEYWDLANFFRETNLKIKWLKFMCDYFQNLNFDTLKDFVFISTFFALCWTHNVNQTKKVLKYRKKVLSKIRQIEKY